MYEKIFLFSHVIYIFSGLQLPRFCKFGSMVTLPWGDEVLYVGCNDGDYPTKDIFKLTWQGDHLQWVMLPQKLKYPRKDAIAMFIPDSFNTDCRSTPQCDISGICIVSSFLKYQLD